MTFDAQLARYRGMVETGLAAAFSDRAVPDSLTQAMRYSLEAGGKRLRPCLTLAACELSGGNAAAALPLALGVEMIHTYSLIHDDLPCMDDDDFRRGKPASHKQFGESLAILAGDGLLTWAFETMLDGALREPGNRGYVAAVHCVARCAGPEGMVAGQVEDLASQGSRDAALLERIHARKTGALLQAAALAGALAVPAGQPVLNALERWAHAFGQLFQITDDILDAQGTLAVLGKTPGRDQEQDKLTYVTLFGLSGAQARAKAALAAAQEALAPLGAAARFFLALSEHTLSRQA